MNSSSQRARKGCGEHKIIDKNGYPTLCYFSTVHSKAMIVTCGICGCVRPQYGIEATEAYKKHVNMIKLSGFFRSNCLWTYANERFDLVVALEQAVICSKHSCIGSHMAKRAIVIKTPAISSLETKTRHENVHIVLAYVQPIKK